ncbi:MAG: hypothetical protein PVG56_06530 [Anaerolineae bacterium]
MPSNERSFPMFSLVYNILAVPYNFFIGFVVGVAAPVAAIAAMVLGVRFLTGKMPFLSLREEEEERRLSLELVSPEVAAELYTAEKEKIMDDLGSFRDEMKSMMEEAQAAAEEAAGEEAASAEAE